MKRPLLFTALFICIIQITSYAQVIPLTHAHAHNDYEHTRPLMDALSYGFTSVEADIYLINDELYVSHSYPEELTHITLKELYLDPLQQILKKNGNKIYPGFTGIFYLMIDLKSDPVTTFQKLHKVISKYPEFINNPNFKVYLSGPGLSQKLNVSDGLLAIDGRPQDVNGNYTSKEMPVISESFSTITKWNGKDTVSNEQWGLAQTFIAQVHKAGKKCRMWAIPDDEQTWKKLLNYHIDFINTDKLEELRGFLLKNK